MAESYYTVADLGIDEYVEKHSRFIATVVPIKSQDEATKTIEAIRSKYWDARHNVYAYTLLEGNIKRYSDDGEPSGTAGVPVLNILEKSELQNVLVVVTRYFGGILLGTGGLVRAYSHAAKLGVEKAKIVKRCLCDIISIELNYTLLGKVQNYLEQRKIKINTINYEDNVKIEVSLVLAFKDMFVKEIVELTDGQISYKENGQAYADFEEINN